MADFLLFLAVFTAGLSGIIAQIILLRELLVIFLGNELTLGVILANWLIAESIGVYIVGQAVDAVKNKINLFIGLEILFSLCLPVGIYLTRIFRHAAGILPGATISFTLIFFSSFLIIFPCAFAHGGLFSCACKLISGRKTSRIGAVADIYTMETLGTIAGGIIASFLLLPFLNSFQGAFIVSITNFLVCLVLLRYVKGRFLKNATVFFAALFISLYISRGTDNLQRISINEQFKPSLVVDYRNSIYGNLTVAKRDGQNTFFYNGIPVITAPFPDIAFVEEFGHLPLLFHPRAGNILILSAGVGGLINEILEHPINKLDYVELDPLIIKKVKQFPSALTQSELSDKRVNVFNMDSRFFIRHNTDKYDVIIIGVSAPWDLSTNRFFTEESFRLMKKRLSRGGILAFYLPGSNSYIGRELRELNACILKALKLNFASTRVIPGDYNIFLASEYPEICGVNSSLISRRIRDLGIKPDILIPAYLDYRLDAKKVRWFEQSLNGASAKINRDDAPYAVFQMLVFWNKQFSAPIAAVLTGLTRLTLGHFLGGIGGITIILFFLLKLKRTSQRKIIVCYSIATTGFFSMLMSLILLFSFQVYYGYVFQMAGLLISVFMAGSCFGALFISSGSAKIADAPRLFIQFELSAIVFTLFCASIIGSLPAQSIYLYPVFLILFFISGVFTGIEFPLSAKIYSDSARRIGATAGVLYFADLIGGAVAGIFGGIFFLPVLGLFNTCILIIFFKFSSVALLVYDFKRGGRT